MRILFTIPHYYDARGGGAYGSLKADPGPRRNALATMLFGLHCSFGAQQGLMVQPVARSNTFQDGEGGAVGGIDVVVCTTAGRHLVDGLPLPAGLLRHHATRAEPRFLGFECHEVMREALGRYDYYCYLEDDLLVSDALFFRKLEWFNRLAGDEAALQPNRFELAIGQRWHKLYIDGNLARPEISERLQDVRDRPALSGEAFGTGFRFERVNNPHSGCFFLNARQMAHWAAQKDFLQRESAFAGPLESAATLGLMRHFRVYKPARENAGFLEIRHLDNRYLGARRAAPARPRPAAAGPHKGRRP
jgi:hypothetical protein